MKYLRVPVFRVLALLHVGMATAISVVRAAQDQQEDLSVWKNISRIVAVGDIHGDHGRLVSCLRMAELVDDQERWTGRAAHLVLVGDFVARGAESRKVLDLLMALEPQAAAAGGRVHVLLGNHEVSMLAGYFLNLTAEDIRAFGGVDELRKAMAADGVYGRWLRERLAVVQINNILFVHGGLSPSYAGLPLREINERIARSLRGRNGAAMDRQGPLWYRGLAFGDEAEARAALETARRVHGADHIVIGHTVTADRRIGTRFDGAVILIDVGMSRGYLGTPAQCLVIDDGRFFAVSDGHREELRVSPPVEPTSSGRAELNVRAAE